ncbi:uncharacterized protein TNCV_1008451 [Trichonephila clavipes]|nr:uncharacterized protein TNCV_1008451 [Trichonephila clavipes]
MRSLTFLETSFFTLADGAKYSFSSRGKSQLQISTLRSQQHEGFLATDHVILNHGQVTWTTPELAPPLLTTTPHQREDVSALDRFNVHRCPTRRVFSGTGLELVTRQAKIRYLYHSATAASMWWERTQLEPGTKPLKEDVGMDDNDTRETDE